MIKCLKLVAVILMTTSVVACGGGGGDSTPPASTVVATSDTTVSVTAATLGAVVNQPFTFAGGVPDFGTTTPTTLAFTSAGATPSFNIGADGATATGGTTFGSCIFTITSSSFPAGSKLAVGQTVRVNPCSLKVATSGGNANGSSSDRAVSFVLGTLSSAGRNLPIVINANGSVVINGITIGTVTIGAVTGT